MQDAFLTGSLCGELRSARCILMHALADVELALYAAPASENASMWEHPPH